MSISFHKIEYPLYSLPDKAAAFPAINDSSVPLVYKSGEIMPFRIVLDTRAPETGRWTKYKLFKEAGCCQLTESTEVINGPRRDKTCLWGFRQSGIQTSLLSYRDLLENRNFACSKIWYDTFQKANNKSADQTAWMRRLVCAFVVRKPPKTGFLKSRPIWKLSQTKIIKDTPISSTSPLTELGVSL